MQRITRKCHFLLFFLPRKFFGAFSHLKIKKKKKTCSIIIVNGHNIHCIFEWNVIEKFEKDLHKNARYDDFTKTLKKRDAWIKKGARIPNVVIFFSFFKKNFQPSQNRSFINVYQLSYR